MQYCIQKNIVYDNILLYTIISQKIKLINRKEVLRIEIGMAILKFIGGIIPVITDLLKTVM